MSVFLVGTVVAYSEGSSPSVATNDATDVTTTSAVLHGTMNSGDNSAAVWFEWGTTTALGARTDAQVYPAGKSTTFIGSVRSLQPHTAYYFRTVLYRAVAGAPIINGDIKTFTTTGDAVPTTDVTATTGGATALTSNSATLNGTVNPGGRSVSAWFDWGTSTSMGNRTDVQMIPSGTAAVPVTFSLGNLQPHTMYYFRMDAYGSAGAAALGDIKTFTTSEAPAAASLTVTTADATAITSSSAALNGKITAGGSAFGAWFEYGTTSSLGTRTDIQTFDQNTTSVNVTQTLRNLRPNTIYYFRAVGYRGGANVRGDVLSFTTGSDTTASLRVATGDASAVSSTSAELRGLINPAGATATAWFEWGSTSSSMNQTTAQTFTGSQPLDYSSALSNLQPNTRYYFRAVAEGSSGTVHGDVKMFTTTRVPSTAPQTGDVEAGQIKAGYLIITPDATSDAPTVTFTYGTINRGAVQSQAGLVPTMMATDASMFVEVIPSISRNIAVAITNPGSSVNTVVLTLRDENGFLLGSPTNVSIPAHQQAARFVSELFGADVIANGLRGSLRMQSPSPFAVIGLRFAGAVFSTLPIAVTAPVPGVPSTTLTGGATPNSPASGTVGGTTAVIIPQFAIAGGWATEIALVNNTNATLVGRIDLFDTSGNPLPLKLNGETRSTFTYSIPVGGTFVLSP